MVYESDIKLDINGNSILKNGDFELTVDDSDFVLIMLMTHEGSWAFHPWLGIGLDKDVGQINNSATRKQIKDEVQIKLKDYGLSTKVLVLPIDDSSIICSVDILSLTGTSEVKFTFNFQSGILNYIEAEEEEDTAISSRSPQNVYMRRRA